ncbi:MAG: methyltransferase domain-containing protein [Candidatus Woesearchaeota archaeon]
MINFLKQFLKNPVRTGAILPSSPALVKAMVAPINFKKAKHIVELGPGTGAITKEILRKMRPDAKLTALEICKEFCDELKKWDDKRLHVIHADAQHLSKHVDKADYITSGLPLIGLPEKAHVKILKEVKKVMKHAYVQFHYTPLGEPYLKRHFKHISRKIAVRNVPPAIVYVLR